MYRELRGTAGLTVTAVPGRIVEGEQGGIVDLLTVGLSGGGLTALLNLITTLVESRGPHFSLKIRRGRQRLEITADNVEEMMPLLKEIMGGS